MPFLEIIVWAWLIFMCIPIVAIFFGFGVALFRVIRDVRAERRRNPVIDTLYSYRNYGDC